MKRIAILGSTGSIGESALDLIQRFPDRYSVAALSAGRNAKALAEQARRFRPEAVALLDGEAAEAFHSEFPGFEGEVLCGQGGIERIATWSGVSRLVAGIVGTAGLLPTLAAVRHGTSVALANKEVLVAAGALVMAEAEKSGAAILPIDSEHSAIFQVLQGHRREHVRRLWLTASGGPLIDAPLEEFPEVTPERALRHPNWDMGRKITIDSATMMNKGLEIVEAHWLFGVPSQEIGVVIHRQSIIHSMVEFRDGSVLAQMGMPDMRVPIAYALAYPERLPLDLPVPEFAKIGRLDFEEPDAQRYPCLALAREAAMTGESAPAVLNAANEAAVEAFLAGKIRFTQIAETIGRVLEAHRSTAIRSIDDALAADEWGRCRARELLDNG